MPKISILTITTRNLYLKEQAHALKAQTLSDFEWILVDDKVSEHQQCLTEAINEAYPVQHIAPKVIREYYAACEAVNTGLVKAKGELIYFMGDYLIPLADALEKHWDIYTRFGGAMTISRCYNIGNWQARLYLKDEIKDQEDRRLAEIFSGQFETKEIEPDIFRLGKDSLANWWGKGDSAPLKALLDCNGFEEMLDGGRADADTNMAWRLANYGLPLYLDRRSGVLEFDRPGVDKVNHPNHAFKSQLLERIKNEGLTQSQMERNLQKERNE